jgi:hypothetical protein
MAKSKKAKAKPQLQAVRHRAVCNDDSFKGPWRTDIDDARADAAGHQKTNPDHDVEVITEQTLSTKFLG